MLLRKSTPQEAQVLASQVCAAIETEAIPHAKSPYGYLTVSIGVARAGGEAEEDQLYIWADEALYNAKNSGRNRIFVYDEKKAQKEDHSAS